MKKSLMFVMIGILSFLGINTVSATTYIPDNYYDNFEVYVDDYTKYKDKIDVMIDYWQDNYSANYPYYAVIEYPNSIDTSSEGAVFILFCSETNIITYYDTNAFIFDNGANNLYDNGGYYGVVYRTELDTYEYNDILAVPAIKPFDLTSSLITSNGLVYDGLESEYDGVLFHSYTSETLGITIPEIELSTGDFFPTVASLYDGSYDTDLKNYVTIDLNQYPYVALALKDYSSTEEFYTNVYVKGQYCLTPVYNYGMTEKKDIITGSKNQRCSTYYSDYTLVRTYILEQDLENHAIYYLKAYDTSKENLVKVDANMFTITYITEETQDNPYVEVNGKNYPTISYDNLTDSATQSEDEDYISGVSCAVGDFNCYNEYNPENIFDSIFSAPLEFLEGVWSSITIVFTLITQFILLLPPVLQTFLYLSFMVAIILGIIKILL